ncbi:hypothetical protein CAPTEDRAFT_191748 [Capitella teleta]|uniref:Uncharacterized protein n=1 Tax=Capitella teleta TaxID=283909 RepID=R7U6C5_CAPTE|nr:hypothetical protein CAPTEDRAFT_191748 [Capitella teleta]|eukprot:ELT98700.1 hypothetical protein CAPTEDRAFT_191748 [Capitella teleta]
MSEGALITKADVIAWFGLSFERGIEWRDRFHGYVSIRTTFPFWTGKVLAGKLWQDLLLESKALFKPVSYLEEATNKGIDPGRISNAVNYAAKNMIRYLDMVKTIEKLELCSHLVKCKDIVKICSDLLFISPEKRISFGGSKQHDVILYLYACKVYLDEVNKVLTSERAGIPFGFKLMAETESEAAGILAEEAANEMINKNFAKALIFANACLRENPFCFSCYVTRGRFFLEMDDYESCR